MQSRRHFLYELFHLLLLYLACGSLGKFTNKEDARGDLERSEMLRTCKQYLIGVQGIVSHDNGDDLLTAHRMHDTHHGDLAYAPDLRDNFFYLFGTHVNTATDNN